MVQQVVVLVFEDHTVPASHRIGASGRREQAGTQATGTGR